MLLRSSSTPFIPSLSQSFAESAANNHQSELSNTRCSPYLHNIYGKLPSKPAVSPNLTASFYNSSPGVSPSIPNLSGTTFRRVQSEGNLVGLGGATSSSPNDVDELSFSSLSRKLPGHRGHTSTLESIQSFPFSEDEGSDEEGLDYLEHKFSEESIDLFYDCVDTMANLAFKPEDRKCVNGHRNVRFEKELYLAKGLGIGDTSFLCNGGYGGGSEGCIPVTNDGNGGDGMEEHYKRLLEENPGNPLYLRNYAQFLHYTKKDLQTADEYYSRAILADPADGEILSQYANLVWELHQDKDRASNYFERAVQASCEDSNVHAAYASFLWETTEEEDQDDAWDDISAVPPAWIREGVTA